MSTLREAQKNMTRDRLLEAGLEVCVEKGYAGAKIDEIARRAGATRTTFYLHFPSKAALVNQLIVRAGEILVSNDGPVVSEVVRTADPDAIRAWLATRMDRWDEIKPYMLVSYQASHEPDVAEQTERWYEDVIAQMAEGLAEAGRFTPKVRRTRSLLAFGQFEYVSRRYFALGWSAPGERELCLDELVRSWRHLLVE